MSYVIGAIPGEGIGENQCVYVVNKLGVPPEPDEVVRCWKSGTANISEFANELNRVGREFGDALIAVEANLYQSTADHLRKMEYPNLYRWKHLDAASDVLTVKYHWRTTANSRARLIQTGRRWLENGAWKVSGFPEIDADSDKWLQPGYSISRLTRAALIALYCGHELDAYAPVEVTA